MDPEQAAFLLLILGVKCKVHMLSVRLGKQHKSRTHGMDGSAHLWVLAIHSANSMALGMVADRKAKRTDLGISTMLSSHTTPLSLSLR